MKWFIFVLAKRRSPKQAGFFLFFWPKNGIFTSEINFFTLLRKFFLGVCGFFVRNVGGFLGDAERPKVKRYLFSKPHFFTFGGGKRMKEDERGGKRNWSNVKVPHLACKV